MADWNVSVVNRTTKSIGIIWSIPTDLLNKEVHFYVALARKANSSSVSAGKIVPASTTAVEITYLHAYTEYIVSVVVVNDNSTQFKSQNVLTMTKEGGE